MSLPIVFRFEASRDTEEAWDFYESKQAGLGQTFLNRLRETIESISTIPEMYAIVWRNVRAARIRKFKNVVYYRAHVDRVEVLAVIHGRRDASAWKNRA
jgi:toxin ParE1/3/4